MAECRLSYPKYELGVEYLRKALRLETNQVVADSMRSKLLKHLVDFKLVAEKLEFADEQPKIQAKKVRARTCVCVCARV